MLIASLGQREAIMLYKFSIIIIFSIGIFINFSSEYFVLTVILQLILLGVLTLLLFSRPWFKSRAAEAGFPRASNDQNKIDAPEDGIVDFGTVRTPRFNLLDLIRSQTELLRTISLSAYSFVFFRDSDDSLHLIDVFPKSLNVNMVHTYAELPVLTVIDQNDGWIFENGLHRENNLLGVLKTEMQFQSIIGFRLNLEADKAFYYLLAAPTPEFFNPDDQSMISDVNKIVLSAISGRIEANAKSGQNHLLARQNNLYHGFLKLRQHNFTDILNFFASHLREHSQAANITIALPKKNTQEKPEGLITHRIGMDDGYNPDDLFPLNEGLAGLALLKNQPYLMDDIEQGELFIPRFSRSEKSNKGIRTFLALPFGTEDKAFGVVCIQHTEPDFYNPGQKEELISWIKTLNLMLNKNSGLNEE